MNACKFLFSSVCLFAVSAHLATAQQPLSIFHTVEHLGIDWQRTLVTYEVEFEQGTVQGESFHIIDDAGARHACQLSRVGRHPDGSIKSARVSFFAELPAGESYHYELRQGAAPAPDGAPAAANRDGYLLLENNQTALRLPPIGEHRPERPLRFGNSHAEMVSLYGRQAESGVIPGPVQGFRLVDGTWAGGSYFWTAAPDNAPVLQSWSCEVVESGPLFVEARVSYEFDNGRYYQLTATLLAGDPAIRIDEQMDMKTLGNLWNLRMLFSLSAGWQDGGWLPDTAYWASCEGRLGGKEETFEEKAAELGFERLEGAAHLMTYGSRVLSFEDTWRKVCDVASWYPWHPNAFYFGLVNQNHLTPDADPSQIPFVGVVPMHAGTWRGAAATNSGMLFTHKADDVDICWHMISPPHPNSLLHTGEYDPDLPLSFVRRQWALVAGSMQYHDTLMRFRGYEGYINLDAYKDWVLDWEKAPDTTHPRLAFDRELIEHLKGQLEDHPARERLEQMLYFNDNDERHKSIYGLIMGGDIWSCARGVVRHGIIGITGGWRTRFRWAQCSGWAVSADELLASENLTDEQRRRVRIHIAAAASMMSDPDFNPRGSMVHLGNPNMPINRFMGLPFVAALIPDHPRASDWLRTSAQYVRYKLSMNTAPGGAWSESISYYYASAPMLVNGVLAAGRSGMLDDHTRELAAQVAEFPLKLLSPTDPRFGRRTVPGFGHEGGFGNTGRNDGGAHLLSAAALVRDADPQRAAVLAWAWDQMGRPSGNEFDTGFAGATVIHADLVNSATPEAISEALASAWIPGFGAVLRSHAGDPNETYLAYRQGYLISHSDPNQGDFVIYSKGAPLTTMSIHIYPFQNHPAYLELHKTFGWHSLVRFGEQSNIGGWASGGSASQVHEHSFGESLDYIRGIGDFGPQRWTRQILFLKGKRADGPNYFVFRDSAHNLDGDDTQLQRKWWYQRTLGTKEQVQPYHTGFDYTSEFGAGMQVRFLQPQTVQIESRQASRGTRDILTINAAGPIPPGQDILVVIYPQGKNEPAPASELLTDGVAKITTSEGIDYVLASRTPVTFQQGDVAFSGTAGAVRIYENEVHLVIAEGPGEARYQGTTLKSSEPATRVIAKDQLKRQVIEQPPTAHSIRFTLNARAGAIEEVQPGVRRQALPDGFAYEFNHTERISFKHDDVTFEGRRGGVVVNRQDNTTRIVVLDAERVEHGNLHVWNVDGQIGACDLTFHTDRISGVVAGLPRFIYLTPPEGLDRLPMLVIDGQTYAPGSKSEGIIMPVLPGKHEIEIRNLKQPPVFRNWQLW